MAENGYSIFTQSSASIWKKQSKTFLLQTKHPSTFSLSHILCDSYRLTLWFILLHTGSSLSAISRAVWSDINEVEPGANTCSVLDTPFTRAVAHSHYPQNILLTLSTSFSCTLLSDSFDPCLLLDNYGLLFSFLRHAFDHKASLRSK